MMFSNVEERWRAQVALFDIGVEALHIIVRSLAQFLIRFSNGNTWRLMETSLCIPFGHYELESDRFGSCRTSTLQKWQRIEKSSDDAGKERAGSAEATATASREIQITRTVKSFKRSDKPRPPAHSPPAKMQKRKTANVKKTRRAKLNPQCR